MIELAESLCWPLLPDVTSGLRLDARPRTIVPLPRCPALQRGVLSAAPDSDRAPPRWPPDVEVAAGAPRCRSARRVRGGGRPPEPPGPDPPGHEAVHAPGSGVLQNAGRPRRGHRGHGGGPLDGELAGSVGARGTGLVGTVRARCRPERTQGRLAGVAAHRSGRRTLPRVEHARARHGHLRLSEAGAGAGRRQSGRKRHRRHHRRRRGIRPGSGKLRHADHGATSPSCTISTPSVSCTRSKRRWSSSC